MASPAVRPRVSALSDRSGRESRQPRSQGRNIQALINVSSFWPTGHKQHGRAYIPTILARGPSCTGRRHEHRCCAALPGTSRPPSAGGGRLLAFSRVGQHPHTRPLSPRFPPEAISQCRPVPPCPASTGPLRGPTTARTAVVVHPSSRPLGRSRVPFAHPEHCRPQSNPDRSQPYFPFFDAEETMERGKRLGSGRHQSFLPRRSSRREDSSWLFGSPYCYVISLLLYPYCYVLSLSLYPYCYVIPPLLFYLCVRGTVVVCGVQ